MCFNGFRTGLSEVKVEASLRSWSSWCTTLPAELAVSSGSKLCLLISDVNKSCSEQGGLRSREEPGLGALSQGGRRRLVGTLICFSGAVAPVY